MCKGCDSAVIQLQASGMNGKWALFTPAGTISLTDQINKLLDTLVSDHITQTKKGHNFEVDLFQQELQRLQAQQKRERGFPYG